MGKVDKSESNEDRYFENIVVCVALTRSILISAPEQPIVTVRRIDSKSIHVSWTLKNGNEGIQYYLVTYYQLKDGSDRHTMNTTETELTVNGLEPGAEYKFVVSFVFPKEFFVMFYLPD